MRFPSTTEILSANGVMEFPDVDPQTRQNYLDRGILVGKCANYLALGKEPPKDFPEYAGYLDGYRLFLKEHDWVMQGWETEHVCVPYQFISHPDQVGVLNHQLAIVEIKTGGYYEQAYRLQTAGQQLAVWEPYHRFCLLLPGDGSYKLHQHTDPRDKSNFITLVQYSHLAMKLDLPVGIRLKQIMEERDRGRS